MKVSSPTQETPSVKPRTTPKGSLREFIGIEDDPVHRWVLLGFGLMVAANVFSYIAGATTLTILEASKFQPWGAITSIGLYDSWESTVALPLLALLWFLLNTRIIGPERRRRSMLLVIGSTYAAVFANITWMLSKSQFEFTRGVSGFEVAVGGIMFVFALANLSGLMFRRGSNMFQFRTSDNDSMKVLLAFIYVTLVAILVLTWRTLTEYSGAMINTEVHVFSLATGVGIATMYELALGLSRKYSAGPSAKIVRA